MLIELLGFEQMFDFPALKVSLSLSLFWLITGWLVLSTSSNLNRNDMKEVGVLFGSLTLVSFLFGTWSALLILMVTGAYFVKYSITVFWSNWNRE